MLMLHLILKVSIKQLQKRSFKVFRILELFITDSPAKAVTLINLNNILTKNNIYFSCHPHIKFSFSKFAGEMAYSEKQVSGIENNYIDTLQYLLADFVWIYSIQSTSFQFYPSIVTYWYFAVPCKYCKVIKNSKCG